MQLPVQITFHGVDPSPTLVARIREHAAKLEQFHDRITRCAVAVELPHQHQRHGRQWRVRIDVTVPGHELVVSRAAGHDGAHEDVFVALRDAFAAARRQIEHLLGRLRTPVEAVLTGPPEG